MTLVMPSGDFSREKADQRDQQKNALVAGHGFWMGFLTGDSVFWITPEIRVWNFIGLESFV